MAERPVPAAETITLEVGQPPRQVRTTVLGHILRVFLVALTIAVPVLFYHVAGTQREKLEKLQARGKQTTGTVISKSSSKTSNTLHYQFSVDGKVYHGRHDVSRDRYDDARVDSELTITYLPDDPAVNASGVVTAGDAAAKGQRILLPGVLCTLVALAGTIAIERSIRRDRRLCQYGIAAQGAVTDQTNDKNAKTCYIFTPEGGQPRHGNTQATFATRRLAIGDALTILYDPAKPTVNKPLKGIAMARVVE